MKKYRNISIILALFLILAVGFMIKQHNELKKVEHALFDVGISNLMIDYQTYSLEASLNELTQDRLLMIYQDGSSLIERDFQKLYATYRELYQYYVVMYGADDQLGNHLQEILQDFQSFFNYLVVRYKDEAFESNDEGVYLISLEDEAYEGSVIIATIMEDLEYIRSEVYENKPTDDREAWKTLVIKNEEHAQTGKIQQDWESIQQMIKMWAE